VAGVCVALSHVELRVVVFYVEYFTSLVALDCIVVKALCYKSDEVNAFFQFT
jgi:hypothetical protein